jgi:enterochelin esterase-like enzyme
LVDSRYRTQTDRLSRGIGGLSSGGYGAMNLGLKHNDVFGTILSLSGYFRNREGITKKLLGNDTNANNPLDYIDGLALIPRTYIFMSIGRLDSQEFLTENRDMATKLEQKQIPFQLIETAGWHDWQVWRRDIIPALKFFSANSR